LLKQFTIFESHMSQDAEKKLLLLVKIYFQLSAVHWIITAQRLGMSLIKLKSLMWLFVKNALARYIYAKPLKSLTLRLKKVSVLHT